MGQIKAGEATADDYCVAHGGSLAQFGVGVEGFLAEAAHRLRVLAQRSDRAVLRVAADVMAALEMYDWPGNVRELVNTLDCAVSLLSPGKDIIDVVPDVIERSLRRPGAAASGPGPMTLEAAEREACIRALEKTGGNVARAARILGVAKATLYAKIRRYGIPHLSTEPGISQATQPGFPRRPEMVRRRY